LFDQAPKAPGGFQFEQDDDKVCQRSDMWGNSSAMELNDDSKITLSPEVMFKEVTGEMVLLDLSNEQYFGLDKVGTRVWELIASKEKFGSIVDALGAEYEIDRETLSADLSHLVASLEKEGLVTVT
jgi:hypothetical protein